MPGRQRAAWLAESHRELQAEGPSKTPMWTLNLNSIKCARVPKYSSSFDFLSKHLQMQKPFSALGRCKTASQDSALGWVFPPPPGPDGVGEGAPRPCVVSCVGDIWPMTGQTSRKPLPTVAQLRPPQGQGAPRGFFRGEVGAVPSRLKASQGGLKTRLTHKQQVLQSPTPQETVPTQAPPSRAPFS